MINIKKLKYIYQKSDYDIQFKFQKNTMKSEIFTKIKDVVFCPKEVQEYFLQCDKMLILTIKDINFTIFFKSFLNISMTKLIKSAKQFLSLKKMFNISKSFNIFFITYPMKRFIPSNDIIRPIHINGGFTSTKENDIFILRTEEFGKVLLHELVHHITIIHNENWSVSQIKQLKQHFRISEETVLIPNEAVVEFWATLFYLFFISFDYHIPIKKLIEIEQKFSLRQTQKLLLFQNKKFWNEKSNAYAYIVLKTILLSNYSKLMKLPYDLNFLTDLFISHNMNKQISSHNNSLRMMILSDI